MAKSRTPRMGVTRWTSGTDTVRRLDFDDAYANIEKNGAMYVQGTLANRPAAGVEGRFYWVTGDSPSNNGKAYYDNGASWTVLGKYSEDVVINGSTSTSVPLTVTGNAGSNVLVVRDQNDTVIFRLVGTGELSVKENTFGSAESGHSVVVATNKVTNIVANTSGSNTSDLQQWITANGKVSFVDSAGKASFKDLASLGPLDVVGSGKIGGNATVVGSTSTAGLITTSTGTLPAITASGPDASSKNLVELKKGANLVARVDQNGALLTSKINLNTGTANAGAASGNAALTISSSATSREGIRINVIASQTGLPFAVSDSSGNTRLSVNPSGTLSLNEIRGDTDFDNVLRLQAGGGAVNIGANVASSKVTFPSARFKMGANNVFIGWGEDFPVASGDSINPNDWWFDATTEEIKVRSEDNTWHSLAKYNPVLRITPSVTLKSGWRMDNAYTSVIPNQSVTHTFYMTRTGGNIGFSSTGHLTNVQIGTLNSYKPNHGVYNYAMTGNQADGDRGCFTYMFSNGEFYIGAGTPNTSIRTGHGLSVSYSYTF